MATIIILILLVLYIVFAFHRSRKRIKNGCCGGGGPVFRDSVQTDQYAIHEQIIYTVCIVKAARQALNTDLIRCRIRLPL